MQHFLIFHSSFEIWQDFILPWQSCLVFKMGLLKCRCALSFCPFTFRIVHFKISLIYNRTEPMLFNTVAQNGVIMLYFLLSSLSFTARNLVNKEYTRRFSSKDSNLFFNTIGLTVTAVICALIGGFVKPSALLLLLAALFGVCFIATVYFLIVSYSKGPLGLVQKRSIQPSCTRSQRQSALL